MFTALGMTYEKMGKKQEAIKCYEKAIIFKDKEGIALHRMAKLYDEMGEKDKAAVCFEENLTKNIEGNIDGETMIESCLYLSKYYKEKTMYDKAYNYWYSIWEANHAVKPRVLEKYEPKVIHISIPIPERKEMVRKKPYNFLDLEEDNDGE